MIKSEKSIFNERLKSIIFEMELPQSGILAYSKNIYIKIKKMWKENLFKKCIACILSRNNLFSLYFHFIFPLRDWVQAYKHLRNNEKMQRKFFLCKIDDCMYWCIYLELDFLNNVQKTWLGISQHLTSKNEGLKILEK